MNYSSVLFVFFFVAGLATFLFLPIRARKPWLLFLSLLWFSFWGVSWAAFFVLMSSLNYASLRHIQSPRGYCLLLMTNLMVFAVLRSGVIVSTPLGTSFILFMLMGVVLERWRGGTTQALSSWLDFILYSQFFLFLMAGPVEKSTRFFEQLSQGLRPKSADVIDGGLILFLGILKATILFPALSKTNQAIMAMGNLSAAHYAVLGFLFSLALYLELSGLCDIARGAARCFGLGITRNFRSMLFSRSPSDFWLRWNITISAWFRDNVSLPLMLRFGRRFGQKPLLIFSFVLMGLWHGLEPRWALFGLFNGLLVIVSLSSRRKWLDRLWVSVLIIGNGWFAHVPQESSLIPRSWWEVWQEGFGSSIGWLFLAWLMIEFVEEWSQKQDWYLASPLWGRTLVLAILCWGYGQGLSRNLISEEGHQAVPIYFQL